MILKSNKTINNCPYSTYNGTVLNKDSKLFAEQERARQRLEREARSKSKRRKRRAKRKLRMLDSLAPAKNPPS